MTPDNILRKAKTEKVEFDGKSFKIRGNEIIKNFPRERALCLLLGGGCVMARRVQIVSLKLAGAFRSLAKSRAFKKTAKEIASKRFERAKKKFGNRFQLSPRY